ncbi:MAG: IS1634 family transposase, partial [Terrimicrobiaceae bacterium]
RTIANLSKWPPHVVEGPRLLFKAKPSSGSLGNPMAPAFRITRSRPHGHVDAVLSTMRKLGIPHLLGSKPSPERNACMALIAARILSPGSKLATSRCLGPETLTSTLAQECALPDDVDENHLYAAMDWFLPRQARIEKALALRHLQEGSLVLYDLTSSYSEGKTCPLAQLGHSRDGKKGKLQIVYGLLCNRHGTPVAVEVFDGNTADPMTLGAQIKKLRGRFGIQRLILVGDRGMITQARIDQELRGVEGLDWISALRSSQIAELVAAGLIQPSLFDQKNLAEIQSPDFPGERLVVCRNPLLARSRAHKREELLAATEADLEKIRCAVLRAKSPLRGAARIGVRVGRVIGKHKMAKHFDLQISDTTFSYSRRSDNIAREAAIDGLYVVRAKVTDEAFTPSQLVERYKDLSLVENAFRSIKTVDLKVRPIHHRDEDRVRCHVFLCMLAYYVEWHMRAALKTVLFDEDDHEAARAERPDVVAPKKPSPSAKRKARTKRCPDGLPVHSFRTLLEDLATITRNTIVPNLAGAPGWQQDAEPTPQQEKIIQLLKTHPMP